MQLIAIRYNQDWVLVSNISEELFRLSPAPGATQILLETWEVKDV